MVMDAYSVCVSPSPGKAAGGRYIAESTTGDQGAGNDDITNFLWPLIVKTLLEISQLF